VKAPRAVAGLFPFAPLSRRPPRGRRAHTVAEAIFLKLRLQTNEALLLAMAPRTLQFLVLAEVR
jgi:hypothetical protein